MKRRTPLRMAVHERYTILSLSGLLWGVTLLGTFSLDISSHKHGSRGISTFARQKPCVPAPCHPVVLGGPPSPACCGSTKPRNSHYPKSDCDSIARQPETTPGDRHDGTEERSSSVSKPTLAAPSLVTNHKKVFVLSIWSLKEIDSPPHRLPTLEYRSL